MKFYLYNTDSDGLEYYEEKFEGFNVYKNPKDLDEDDIYYREKSYVVELKTLEELIKFSEAVEKRLVILIDDFKDETFDGAIEIYDYYRE